MNEAMTLRQYSARGLFCFRHNLVRREKGQTAAVTERQRANKHWQAVLVCGRYLSPVNPYAQYRDRSLCIKLPPPLRWTASALHTLTRSSKLNSLMCLSSITTAASLILSVQLASPHHFFSPLLCLIHLRAATTWCTTATPTSCGRPRPWEITSQWECTPTVGPPSRRPHTHTPAHLFPTLCP